MRDIDWALSTLAARDADPRLDRLEQAVLAGLAREKAPVLSHAMLGSVAALALAGGVATSFLPQQGAVHPGALGGDLPLAPATLLTGAR